MTNGNDPAFPLDELGWNEGQPRPIAQHPGLSKRGYAKGGGK